MRMCTVLVALAAVGCGDPASPLDAGVDPRDAALDALSDATLAEDAARDAGVDAAGDAGESEDSGMQPDGGGVTTITFDVGPWTLGAATEESRCVVVDAGGASGRRVSAIRTASSAGTYALMIMRSDAPLTPTPVPCASVGGVALSPLFVASSGPAGLALPSDTEIVLAPGERLRIAVSAVNAGTSDLEIATALSLDVLPDGAAARAPLTAFFAMDPSISVAPGATSTEDTFHAMPSGAVLVALATQTHAQGVARVRHASSASDTTGSLLVEALDWSSPPISIASPRITFTGSDGLHLSCTITNPGGTPIAAGDSSSDEVCLLLAYHL